ncbi:DUF3592 domain-containing protein [Dokdonella sp.]|uniref:DUF3592 domain-containing protein n=1 Tax=Dokdonella sp. TaxID=2291710 RepID=UPI003C3573CB
MPVENGLLKWSGIVLAGLGALFVVLGIYFVWYANSAMWVETPATVSSVQIRTSVHSAGNSLQRGTMYYPQIRYDYTANGKQFSSRKWRLRTEHESYAEREEAVTAAAKYKNGDAIAAYYNRDQPSVAVLQPGAHYTDYISLLVGLLFGLTGWLLHKFRFQAESSIAST